MTQSAILNCLTWRSVAADHGILAVAIRTPPYKLVLSKAIDLEEFQLIAHDIQEQGKPVPGVSGLVTEVATFLQAWQVLTGQAYRRVMAMQIHQLTQVQPVAMAKEQIILNARVKTGMSWQPNVAEKAWLLTQSLLHRSQ